ncbi:sigma-54-dependent transcriptional regulator [Chondromyces apiculatus]|uniref:Sigma54 dependent transcriptional regulator n=1 Tax=Chondromyces apiculatus DSM 436 TaxID=1192034 RepID=A0A017T3H9_9BACT|nr:sigma-54 dependent transcriptional regulator [Chondromyces apiculatus]EYF03803.1 sigma54 dependent transcriptional regulator [Chondromyces apiculatus DSM 436]
MSTILIVDDEKGIRDGLATAVARVGHRAVTAPSLAEARARLLEAGAGTFDCALVDIRLKDGSGLDLLRELQAGRHRDLPVIMATAYDDSERTIEAMRDGAFDYLTKPFDLPRLMATVERAVKQRRASETTIEASAESPPLVGRSAAMHAVWKRIGRSAGSDAPVLVKGEGGAGKKLVARAIHDYSRRASAPLTNVRVDASTDLPELRAALAAAPSGGTLLIDGAGDLPPAVQSHLGSWVAEEHPVRVIALARLAHGAAEVPLLPELYYQLAVIEISVPPLRERRSDIPLLVSRALSGTRARAISEEAMAALVRHDWPGNVRELFLCIRRAAEMCRGEVIDADDLPPELAMPGLASEPADPYLGLPLREALARLERDLLSAALRRADGNRTVAARLLGIPRPQLYTKLEEHGLSERKPGSAGGKAPG